MIYQLYKKQVEAWKERFTEKFSDNLVPGSGANDFFIGKDDGKKVMDFISSSRHKDTIELLEAEIERKKELKEQVFPRMGYTGEKAVRQQAIDEDIAYLEGELRKLKNER